MECMFQNTADRASPLRSLPDNDMFLNQNDYLNSWEIVIKIFVMKVKATVAYRLLVLNPSLYPE